MVPEARLEQTEDGLVPASAGWFVLNAKDARWQDRGPQGFSLAFDGDTDFEQVGVNLKVLGPGEPMANYHWETDEEDFFVLSGEAILIIEGEERRIARWDFVHCPPEAKHTIVGAGDGPCAILAIGARERHTTWAPDGTLTGKDDWGAYTVDEAALRHGAGVEEETSDTEIAYARFPERRPTRYRDGLLPD